MLVSILLLGLVLAPEQAPTVSWVAGAAEVSDLPLVAYFRAHEPTLIGCFGQPIARLVGLQLDDRVGPGAVYPGPLELSPGLTIRWEVTVHRTGGMWKGEYVGVVELSNNRWVLQYCGKLSWIGDRA